MTDNNKLEFVNDFLADDEVAERLYRIGAKLDFVRAALADAAFKELAQKVMCLNCEINEIADYLADNDDDDEF